MGSVTRIIHISLPSTLAEFLQREGRSGRRKDIIRTESIILVSNTYDYIICKNEFFFRKYINSSAERLLLLLDSPFSYLYNLIFRLMMDKALSEEEQVYLIQLGILEDGSLTSKGKFYQKNFLSFFGSTQYISLYNKHSKLTKERVSRSDILLQYQPHTLHFRNYQLQRVKEFKKTGSRIDPVFEIINKKDKLYELYFKQNLRSTVFTNVKTRKEKDYSVNIEELSIIPVSVVYTYLNEFQKYETYDTFLVDKTSETLLSLFIRLEGLYQTFNAEMAVHCIMEALRITKDIRYTELRHNITSKENECKILLYESELSGLLLYIDVDELIATSKTIYVQYIEKLKKVGKESIEDVYPIPTCQYQKKTKDFHLIYQVVKIIESIGFLIGAMKKNFTRISSKS